MGIRLSGLVSGMDTESLVSALVSSYSMQKNNLVKAQTKLSWKQETWKTMNTSIYGFYSGKLSAARMSKTYNLKTASISNDKYAKVTASGQAVNGSQTLEVKELAATGYLTGGEISGKDKDGNTTKLSGNSKLSEVNGMGDLNGAALTVNVKGASKTINMSADMTIDQFVGQLKSAGLEASFDAANQRFFVSSSASGKDADFGIIADNAKGMDALNKLGLLSVSKADKAEYQKWANYADDAEAMEKAVDEAYKKVEIKLADRAKAYADTYNSAKSVIDAMTTNDTWMGRDEMDLAIADYEKVLAQEYDYAVAERDDEGNPTKYDESLLREEDKEAYNKIQTNIANIKGQAKIYDDNMKLMSDMEQYVNLDEDGKAVAVTEKDADTTKLDNVKAKVAEDNQKIRDNIANEYSARAQYAKSVLDDLDSVSSKGAVRIEGQDAHIVLNGADFYNSTSNFSINGLTIQAIAKTGDEKVTITTNTDVDGIYDTIKEFIKEYNALIKAMDGAYNADSAKGYEPLTSEEKEAMTDDEIEKWEKKIKDSLLRKDSTLGNTASALKMNMGATFEINGKKYSLASFGIMTQGYFASGKDEKGVFHIDGDKDDTLTGGKDDKLRAAIASDPDTVISFFSQLATKVYNDLGNRMSSTSMRSIYTIYNDKEMAIEYSSYNTKISDQEDKVKRLEDFYYAKFSRMESAMAKLNSQQSSLSNFFSK